MVIGHLEVDNQNNRTMSEIRAKISKDNDVHGAFRLCLRDDASV